jgi:cytochrome b pre-mRNA-processing protein 3
MVLTRLFGSKRNEVAERLYDAIVAQARQPAFYANYGVPDTVDGRFEMISLHMFLVLHRLKREGPAAAELAQDLFDTMFDDMDRSLREMGAGDLGVGKRVRAMGEGLYGRIAAYEAGLAAGDAELTEALRRNLFGTVESTLVVAGPLCAYIRAAAAILAEQPAASLACGTVRFPPVPGGPA